ncbi:MAG: bis(5'-nucleosyl)-tetraphosphatase (symmetrical) YqeK [Lachnospiraceae bacterium]|nr:bis(5'-nucleosyl)-tetraphosphatase (symmetrical) YqeK [Lachnospiraceae bacterium]
MDDWQGQANAEKEHEEAWIPRIKAGMSEDRFRHTLAVAEIAVSLAKHHGLDEELVRKTALLHDIAKDMSREEMLSVAEKYGHTMSAFSLKYTSNMHAELGALIAEREFGLSDKDALNAIRFHVSARPDMSLLEKIIFFADHIEPSGPDQDLMHSLYEIAKTNPDLAILRFLPVFIDYQLTREVPEDIREICTDAYDFLLDAYTRKNPVSGFAETVSDILSDEEFDEAAILMRRNQIRLASVENARWLRDFPAADGKKVKEGLLIRCGNLYHLTEEEADYLKNSLQLSLVIDLRTPSEAEKASDQSIPGVRYENIPLSYMLDTTRMDYLAQRYSQSHSVSERAWYTEQYARVDEATRMYMTISTDVRSIEAIRRILHLLTEASGPVLFHCTSGKDRTGILAALILSALGCDREDIIRDYNASAVSFFSMAEKVKTHMGVRGEETEELKHGLQASISVVPAILRAGLAYIDKHYISFEDYLSDAVGFGREDQARLRDKYLI